MNKRIIHLQKLFSDAIQYFPADQPARPIPFLSQIAWVPVKVNASQCVKGIGLCSPVDHRFVNRTCSATTANPRWFEDLLIQNLIPLQGSPAVFVLDPSSNQLGFAVVAQWSGMGATTLLIVILTAVVPLLLTSVLMRAVATSYWSYLEDLRKLKIQQENTIVDIYEQAQIAKLEEHDKQDKFEIHEDVIRCAAPSITLHLFSEWPTRMSLVPSS